VRTLEDNAALAGRAAAIIDPPVEFMKVPVDDGVVLDGYMLKPKTFDAARKYPVVVFVHGEPAGVTVNDAWGGMNMFFLRAIASQGYVVVSFDNRGTPALKGENATGYRAGSSIHFAEGLRGNLLIVHGSGDDNVHYQGTERLVNRLIELKKPFDMMVYPNRSHSISEGPGTSLHVYALIARYIVEHLPAGPR
jgi:dipeptidyl aminopeptidase/acylaminoacyl peptidase